MRLLNKSVLITGAASGIGRACAERFVREGAAVMLADVDAAGVAAAAEAINALPTDGQAQAVACDVGDRQQVEAAVAATVDSFGGLDICISNAGIVHAADFLELDEADFDRVLRVNLKGVFLSGQAAARQMVRQQKPGCIINMSSVNAVVAIPNQVPYVTAKGGIAQLTKVMALSLAPHGIRVNAIGPGSILTEMLQQVMHDETARRTVMSRTPLGRCGTVEEVAGTAVFLAGEDSSYMTGQTLYVDGGRLSLNYTVAVAD